MKLEEQLFLSRSERMDEMAVDQIQEPTPEVSPKGPKRGEYIGDASNFSCIRRGCLTTTSNFFYHN